YSGHTAVTADCIHKVTQLWQHDPALGEKLDHQMGESVTLAKTALQDSSPLGLTQLAQAINKAGDCFFQWGLINPALQQHMQILLDAGAIAIKSTGSGDGGYVLSLWDNEPPKKLMHVLIKI